MTREEITENIKAMCDEAIESDGTLLYINTETAETIRMAIEALSAEKIWGKILMMPKYVITEWCFPRKKKRGTMRRNRRKGGDTE